MLRRLGIYLLLLLLLPLAAISCAPATTTPTPGPVEAGASPTTTPLTQPSTTLSLPSISDIIERARPAVVAILTERLEPGFFLRPVPVQGAGSGFIFRPDGYILTNNHVVEGSDKITVSLTESTFFPEGATFEGQVVGRDPLSDLAVVKIEAQGLPTIPMGDSSRLRLGDWLIAIGNAQALPGGPTVTLGIVSALGRSISPDEQGITLHDLIQTDAAINPGNSGGPLLNLQGEVVGINTAIVAGAENIGFAIATSTAIPIRDDLLAYGKIKWGWMGVSISDLTATRSDELGLSVKKGVFVENIFQGNPADKAGVRAGDVIIRLGDKDTPAVDELQKELRRYRAGDKLPVTLVRRNQTLTIVLTLGEIPQF